MEQDGHNAWIEEALEGGGSAWEEAVLEKGRQYGGYGLGGGSGYGLTECCEGVVDPLLLLTIIAGNDYGNPVF